MNNERKERQDALGLVALGGGWPMIRHPLLRGLLRHWAEARQGASVPFRTAIDPARMPQSLPHLWLYRYDSGRDDFLCTLAGEDIRVAWGRPIMHRYLTEFMPVAVRDLVSARCRRILEMPALMTSSGPGDNPGGQFKVAKRLVVPLLDADGACTIILGLSAYEYTYAETNFPVAANQDVIFHPCDGLPREAPASEV